MLTEHQRRGDSAYLGTPNRYLFQFHLCRWNKYPAYCALIAAGNRPDSYALSRVCKRESSWLCHVPLRVGQEVKIPAQTCVAHRARVLKGWLRVTDAETIRAIHSTEPRKLPHDVVPSHRATHEVGLLPPMKGFRFISLADGNYAAETQLEPARVYWISSIFNYTVMHECIVTVKIETIQIKLRSSWPLTTLPTSSPWEVLLLVVWSALSDVCCHPCVHALVCTHHTQLLRWNYSVWAGALR